MRQACSVVPTHVCFADSAGGITVSAGVSMQMAFVVVASHAPKRADTHT